MKRVSKLKQKNEINDNNNNNNQQVAYALNCPQTKDEELSECLKTRDIHDLLNVKIDKPKYVPAFAPLVDSTVIPDKPINLMRNVEHLSRQIKIFIN